MDYHSSTMVGSDGHITVIRKHQLATSAVKWKIANEFSLISLCIALKFFALSIPGE